MGNTNQKPEVTKAFTWFHATSVNGGAMAIAATIATYFSLYVQETIGITAAQLAVIMFICTLWDAINDPIMGVICDSVTQNTDGSILVWLVAPFDETNLPYDQEFITQDIEQECDQMPAAFQEIVDLLFFDRSSNMYQHIESRNFSAPYYLEEKSIYHQLCSYPSFLEDFFDINEIKNSDNIDNSDYEFGDESFEK